MECWGFLFGLWGQEGGNERVEKDSDKMERFFTKEDFRIIGVLFSAVSNFSMKLTNFFLYQHFSRRIKAKHQY